MPARSIRFPVSLHLSINFAYVERADALWDDLAAAMRIARRLIPRRLGNLLLLSAAQTANRLPPQVLVSSPTTRLSGMSGPDEQGMPRRSAPVNGMKGWLPNRGYLKEVVLDLVDQFTAPQAWPITVTAKWPGVVLILGDLL